MTIKRGFVCFFLIAVSFVIAYLICWHIVPQDVYPPVSSAFLNGKESFQIISIDPETKVQLVWAYEAVVSRSLRQKSEEYVRKQDISFKRLLTDTNWNISDEGYLQSETIGSGFSLKYPKYSNHLYVFCFRTVGGDAVIRHDFPGGHSFYRIEGKNTDAVLFSSAMKSETAWQIPQWFLTILTALFLSVLLVFIGLKWLGKVSLPDPEPIADLTVKTPLWGYLTAFLAPVLITIIVCWINGFAPFGNKTFLYNDMLHQNFKFILYLKNMTKESNDIFYSFSEALGGNMYSLFAYYLCDPLIYFVYFVPEEQIPVYCTFLISLHFGLSGLTSFFYLRKKGRTINSSLMFSSAYALMTFNIVCAENPYFIVDGVLLPLVILDLEREVRQNRPLLYVLLLAASLVSNVYFGYMVCIFALIWFFFIEISENRKTIRADFINFLIYSLLAVGLAMIVILPFAVSLGEGPKSFSLELLKPRLLLDGPELLSKLMTGSFNHEIVESNTPSLFCGTVTTVFMLLYFIGKKRTVRERFSAIIISCVFLLSFSVSTFYLIWHGFNYPIWWPSRFAFTFGFFMIYLASEAFDERDDYSPGILLLVFLLFSAICLIVFKAKLSHVSEKMILLDFCIALTTVLLISFPSKSIFVKKIYPVLIMLILWSDLGLNMAHIWKTNFDETYPKTAITAEEYIRSEELIRLPLDQIKTNDRMLYRTEFSIPSGENQGFQYSVNPLSHFSSTDSNDVRVFLDRLGFTARYRLSSNYRYGSTMTVDSLLGIKYLVSESGLDKKPYPVLQENEAMVFQKNPYALPLGMAASAKILTVNLLENEVFDNQEQILSAITDEPIKLFSQVQNITLSTENLSSEVLEQYTVWEKIDQKKPGKITWNFSADRNDMLYAYFPVLSQRTGTVWLNGNEIGKTIDPDNYGVIPLGAFETGDLITVSLQFDAESIALFEPKFIYEDREKWKTLFNEEIVPLADLTKHSSSFLTGNINADSSDQWLFLTIPYSDEWKIKVNGKAVTAEKTMNALMAVPLQTGQNHIEMYYIPKGFVIGSLISFISVVILFLSEKKRRTDCTDYGLKSPQKIF